MARALAGGAAINARNRLGESALVIVLKNNHPELAPALIDAGADVNLAAINGITPLMAAAYIGADRRRAARCSRRRRRRTRSTACARTR